MLQQIFLDLLNKYSSDHELAIKLRKAVEAGHSQKKRHYHTLEHLENLYHQLLEIKDNAEDWGSLMFSLFYHDIVYNSLKKDNEEKSASLAEKQMSAIGVSNSTIQKTVSIILATKSHLTSSDIDTNYFLDADLSVLGFPWNGYKKYFEGVRKEYAIYPDIIYKPGRKKVLQHFLQMDCIYKTQHFQDKFEAQAKTNLQQEFDLL